MKQSDIDSIGDALAAHHDASGSLASSIARAQKVVQMMNSHNRLRAELSEAIDVIEALVLNAGWQGSASMQRASEFVKRMKEGVK